MPTRCTNLYVPSIQMKLESKATAKTGRPVDPRKDVEILRVARELVFTEGTQSLNMARVAELAAVSKVTLYTRYSDRNELLQAVLSNEAQELYKKLGEFPCDLQMLRDGLLSFADATSKFLCSDRHHYLMQAVGAMPKRKKDLEVLYHNGPEKTHQYLANYLRAADEKGLIECPESIESAELLLGMLYGIDMIRATYRVPIKRRNPSIRKAHTHRIVSAFLLLHTNQSD